MATSEDRRWPHARTTSWPLTARSVHQLLADAGVAGGAVYDALVALAVREADAELLTRDARAAATYAALRVRFRLIA